MHGLETQSLDKGGGLQLASETLYTISLDELVFLGV